MGKNGPGGPGRPAPPGTHQAGDDDPGRGGNREWDAQLSIAACSLIAICMQLVTWMIPNGAVAAGKHSPTGGAVTWGHPGPTKSAPAGTGSSSGGATSSMDDDENGGVGDETWRPDPALQGSPPHDADAIARLKRLQRELLRISKGLDDKVSL